MATILGLMHLDLYVPQANSLKDKRRIIKGFKDRCRHRFNVTIAEVEGLETTRRATLAVAMTANDRIRIESELQKITNLAGTHRDMVLVERTVEWL